MKRSVLTRLALKSMTSRKKLYFPYLLAISFLFSLEYVMLSLLSNEYVNQRSDTLPMLVGIGVFFTSILTIIIALYAGRFVSKTKQQELGLYAVLGLENKHIRFMIAIEHVISWVITSLLGVLLGYGLGKVLFISLNRMMRNTGATFMDYPFDQTAALLTMALLLAVFFMLFLTDSFRLRKLTPAALLTQANAGESEPKANIWVALFGVLTLASGYFIAMTSEGVLQSMTKIFLAIFLVIIGTYCLFLSGSILVLKGMKKKKAYYYQPNHFLSISGMLYRMKANAVSLATISILCGGIVLTLSATLTLYRGMQEQVDGVMPRDYSIELADEKQGEQTLNDSLSQIEASHSIEQSFIHHQLLVPAELTEQKELNELSTNQQEVNGRQVFILAQTVHDYNQMMQTNEELKQNELLLASNLIDVTDYDRLEVADSNYQVKQIDASSIPSNYGVEVMYLVVANQNQLERVQDHYHVLNPRNQTMTTEPINQTAYFDASESAQGLQSTFDEVQEEQDVSVQSKKSMQEGLYGMNGGLLFIGMIVGLVLLVGTILMLYFKQITEGYADRSNYFIMKRVGLPSELIKKTIRSQIIWIFGLPIAIGLIHILFATNIMSQMMGVLGITDMSLYFSSYLIVAVIFAALYFAVYLLTSYAYYHIVDTEVDTN